jgi:ASC-1-like (ASCH) protein
MEHLMIVQKKYFNLIISGKKTIETRWSRNKITPYKKVKIGETILIKESGKPITYKAIIKDAKFYDLKVTSDLGFLTKYNKEICLNEIKNIKEFEERNYCTLIFLEKIESIKPTPYKSNGSAFISKDKIIL